MTTSQRSAPVVAPAGWLVVLSRHGATAGAIGPFATDADATSWAASLPTEAGWRWTVQPMLDPAELPTPAAAPPPRRRHLTLVQ